MSSGTSSGAITGVSPKMSPSPQPCALSNARAVESRRPLAQLLHALNQPLTGLQCSMEVALAGPRTPQQYLQGLREGLELTGRMRELVHAIREVTDLQAEENEQWQTVEWQALLQEAVDDLNPVAVEKGIRIVLDCSAVSQLAVRVGQRRLATLLFQSLESVLSLAAPQTLLRVETEVGSAETAAWLRIRWQAECPASAFSRPELGFLIAQAGWERMGADWRRERAENQESIAIRLPRP